MDARLTPNRSLSARAFLFLMLAFSSVNAVMALIFVRQGAYPVAWFLLIDVVLLAYAFRLNYRAGRIFERVRVAFGFLHVARKPQRGRPQHWVTNPLWARVEPGEDAVRIAAGGREVAVASFLSPDERDAFADALKEALLRARVR